MSKLICTSLKRVIIVLKIKIKKGAIKLPSTREKVHLHLKVLENPGIPINDMVNAMSEVYSTAGFDVEIVSTETLNLPHLKDLDIGICTMGNVTDEQKELFENRNNVKVNELTVYFVRSTIPPTNGCAAHPSQKPGAVVTSVASVWTLGHEIGHVLGLRHVNNNEQLMTGNGTGNITNPPPDLSSSEIETMRNSQYTTPN